MPNITIYNEEDSAADLAIVGLGPGGLAAALQAAVLGKKVLAFTDRTEYVRGQRVKLSRETLSFLNEHTDLNDPADRTFRKKYVSEDSVQTKDLEKFLFRKLETSPNATIVSLNKHAIKSLGTGKDGSANFLETLDGNKYYFHHLLGADGAKHSTSQLVKKHLNPSINYATVNANVRHPYHATVLLQVKPGVKPTYAKSLEPIITKMESLRKEGWPHFHQPEYFIFSNAAKTKFYFVGEVLEKIYEASDEDRPELLRQWAAKAILEKYSIPQEYLEFRNSKNEAKNRLQSTVFKMGQEKCETALFALSNGFYAPIGDARRTPYYPIGHGLNDAIKGGIAFAKACVGAHFQRELFTSVICEIDANIDRRIKGIESTENMKKARKKEKLLYKIDKLIKRLKRNETQNASHIQLLSEARTTFQTSDELSSVYNALTGIYPITQIHKNTGILYQAFRYIASFFDSKATMTRSARIYEKIADRIDRYTTI